jgi:hypothetical protein
MISEQASKELYNNFRWSLGCELPIIWPPDTSADKPVIPAPKFISLKLPFAHLCLSG